ncbi:MAG: hypothetical protein ACI93R_001658 [Flavobacteriales bacterium]|jgi:hypothetical protein
MPMPMPINCVHTANIVYVDDRGYALIYLRLQKIDALTHSNALSGAAND